METEISTQSDDICSMNLSKYAVIWPEVKNLFPLHSQQDRLPTARETQAKIDELYESGDSLNASRLTLWWGSIPESDIPRNPINSMHPQLDHSELSYRENKAFSRLAELPQLEDEAYRREEKEPTGIRFRDFAVPVAVMVLVVVFMLSAVFINGISRVVPEGNGTERLDRFQREPVVIAPEASYAGQPLSSTDKAPKTASQFFKSIHVYRISDQLELSPNPTKEVAELWRRTVAVFGADAKRLESFGIAYEDDSLIAGYLDLDTRTLVINLNGTMTDSNVQNFTLVHEYNHMVTLMGQYESGASCDSTLLLNGNVCLDENSSLQRWINRFWNEPGMLKDTSTGNVEAGEKRFSEMPEDFVSTYAASAPQEDMAESFAAWVFGYTMPEKKHDFFDNDPESRALKARILSSLNEI